MKTKSVLAILLTVVFFLLQGCASSGATRGAAGEADKVYLDTNYSLTHINGSLRDSIQNSSQTKKGVLLGGLMGAISGSMYSSSIGFFPGLAGGAIIGGAIGAYVDDYTTPQDKLENRGVNVIVLGDQVKLIVPSTILFEDNSAVLRPQAYSTLTQMCKYVGLYPNISIKVAAFTSAWASASVNQSLSQHQAEAVTRYMWKKGINTRLLYAAGYGGTQLVAENTPDWSSDNFRIEITLEKLPM